MQRAKNHLSAGLGVKLWSFRRALRIGCLLSLAFPAFLAPVSAYSQNSGTIGTPLNNPPPRPTGVLLPEANRPPDANAQMEMREQKNKTQNFAAANAERKRQISDDSARLLKLAADLLAEVDKTSKDTLSINVIRKADEIERLAHNVKEKMKLTVGGS
jgi:hypothetical protein